MANDNNIKSYVVLDDASVDKLVKALQTAGKKAGEEFSEGVSEGTDASKDIFSGFKGGVVFLNQALELAEKFGQAISAITQTVTGFVKEAENIRAINSQFALLSSQAGLVGSNLEESLIAAGRGLVDTEDLLQSANRAILTLGESASQIPQIFELAQKATQLFGGEATQNFELISNAIAAGNTRSLRQLGIIIDSEKAFKDFAISIGTTSDQLNQAGRSQAILNATLEKGEQLFKNIDPNLKEGTNAFKRLGVEIGELGDTIALVFESKFGKALTSATNSITSFVNSVSKNLMLNFGDSVDSAGVQIEFLTKEIAQLQTVLAKGGVSEGDDFLTKRLKGYQSELDILKAKSEDSLKAARMLTNLQPAASPEASGNNRFVNAPTAQDVQKNQMAYQQALVAANAQNLQLEIQNAQLIQDEKLRQQELERLNLLKIEQLKSESNLRLELINQNFSNKMGFSQLERNELIKQETIRHNEEIENLQVNHAKAVIKTTNQMTAAVTSILVNGTVSAFTQVGKNLQAGKGLFDDFGASVVSLMGDVLIAIGTQIVATSQALLALAAALTNPFSAGVALAAGLGLIVLGSALKASVDTGGGGSGGDFSAATPAGSFTGGGVSFNPDDTTSTIIEETEPQGPRASVVVNIQGNILDRRQSGLELTEIIQEAFDQQGVEIKGRGFA